MKICPNCNAQVADEAMFCTTCGASLGFSQQTNTNQENTTASQQGTFPAGGFAQNTQQNTQQDTQQNTQQNYQQYYNYQQPYIEPWDHTAEFTAKDISDNKVLAMLLYLVGGIAIIYALLGSQKSDYLSFHVRQVLKFMVVEVLLAIIAAVLCWTIVIPIAAGICLIILFVVKIICFFQIASNKSVEPAIIRSLGFLK